MKRNSFFKIFSIILIIVTVTAFPVTAKAPLSGGSSASATNHMQQLKLTSKVKKAQKALVNGIKKMNYSIDISKYKIPVKSASYFYMGTVYENPDLFWVGTTFYFFYEKGYITSINPDYYFTAEDLPKIKTEYNNRVNDYLASIQPNMSDYDKALVLHDKLVSENSYNDDAIRKYCAYGALNESNSVCQGYALAYAYMLKKVGIKSHIVHSDTMNHVWNIVKIGGKWYHVDATWDDEMIENNKGKKYDSTGRVLHKYFLINSSRIKSGDYGHYDFYTFFKSYNCKSSKYHNSFDKKISSKIVKIDNSYYYALNNSLIKKTGKRTVKCTSKNAYTIDRVQNLIYFNDSKSLYYYDVNTGKTTKQCNFTLNSENNYVKGISIISDKLYYLETNQNNTTFKKYSVSDITFLTEQIVKIKKATNVKEGISLQWTCSSDAEKYEIYRKKSGGKYKLIATVSNGTNDYLDKKVKNKAKYYYFIKTAPQRVASLSKNVTRKKCCDTIDG